MILVQIGESSKKYEKGKKYKSVFKKKKWEKVKIIAITKELKLTEVAMKNVKTGKTKERKLK